jgi:1-acyl-sn-glycerol-3-phosphate acyltransferase
MQTLRAWAIIVVFLAVTLAGIPYQSMALRFGWKSAKTFPNSYHRFMARLFGIRIKTIGKLLTGEGVLIVANHTSWMDIVVFSAVGRLSFVAKSEVATWPLFSTLAKLQQTVFVERTRRHATGQARDQIANACLLATRLCCFPKERRMTATVCQLQKCADGRGRSACR